MHREFLNSLIKKSDLTKTDYHPYNKSRNPYKKTSPLSYEKLLEPNFSNYIVLDFETTGFSAENDKIIEIGAIKVHNHQIVDTFDTLINPNIKIPPFIANKINITDAMVSNKPFIDDIFKDFAQFLDGYNLVIHNSSFDMRFLIENGKRLDYNINNPALDTVGATKKLFPELKKYNLAFLCNHFDISNLSAHRAMFDAKATYELYKILFEKYSIK